MLHLIRGGLREGMRGGNFTSPLMAFLAHLDEVHEELLYYPQCRCWPSRRGEQNVKVFTLKFFM